MVEVVEELGLITCEMIVYRHGAILLIVRECSGFLTIGGDDIEDGVPDKEKVDCERKKVEEGEKQERDKHEVTTNAQTCDFMDGMWME